MQSAVAAMVIDANCRISPEVLRQLECCRAQEERPLAASILGRIIENDQLAAEQCVPMCQDTGMAVFRVQLGQDVHITGGSLEDAIQEGVRQGLPGGLSAQIGGRRPGIPPGQHRRQHPRRHLL